MFARHEPHRAFSVAALLTLKRRLCCNPATRLVSVLFWPAAHKRGQPLAADAHSMGLLLLQHLSAT